MTRASLGASETLAPTTCDSATLTYRESVTETEDGERDVDSVEVGIRASPATDKR